MDKKGNLKHFDFLVLDFVCLALSVVLAVLVRGITVNDDYRLLFTFEALGFFMAAYFYNPYKNILKRTSSGLINYNIGFGVVQVAITTLILFGLKFGDNVSRMFVFGQYASYFVICSIAKLFWRRHLLRKARLSTEVGKRTILIVTERKRIDHITGVVGNRNYDFHRILGLCVIDEDLSGESFGGYEVVCARDGLLSYVCRNWVDEVFFDVPYARIPDDILSGLSRAGITTHIRLRKVEAFEGKEQRIQKIFQQPVLTSSVKERTNKQLFLKGCLDVAGGVVGCLLTIVLACIIGPIIKLKSPGGPIFYKQERIGLNGRRFYMYKFRSMVPDAELKLKELEDRNRVKGGLMFKVENDPRIIPGIGNFIRKTSLDEFPQFFNVLRGEMSLVGTRPPTVNEWEKYRLEHRIRMSTKPGITGMWQVSGRNEITDFDKVVELDSYYITNWSIGLDIEILIKTVVAIFIRKSKKEAM